MFFLIMCEGRVFMIILGFFIFGWGCVYLGCMILCMKNLFGVYFNFLVIFLLIFLKLVMFFFGLMIIFLWGRLFGNFICFVVGVFFFR